MSWRKQDWSSRQSWDSSSWQGWGSGSWWGVRWREWRESSHTTGGGSGGGGDSDPTSRGSGDSARAPRERVPQGPFLVTFWPVNITGYPARGSPNSWTEIWQAMVEVGCDITLSGRATSRRQHRRAKLALRGPPESLKNAWRILVKKTIDAGIELDMRHLPVVTEDDEAVEAVEDEKRDELIAAADEQEAERVADPDLPQGEADEADDSSSVAMESVPNWGGGIGH